MLAETELAVADLNKKHADLMEKFVKRYEDNKDKFAEVLKGLPEWIRLGIEDAVKVNPSFILTEYPTYIFASSEAVVLAGHMSSRSDWVKFCSTMDFNKYGGISPEHNDMTLKLMLSITNEIVLRTHPEIILPPGTAVADADEKPILRLVRD